MGDRRVGSPACLDAASAGTHEEAERLVVAATRARVAELVATRDAIAGEPLAWEAFPSTAARPDRVPDLAERAARAAGAKLVALECEEPPCVAMFEIALPMSTFNEDQGVAQRALQDGFGGEIALSVGMSEADTSTDPIRVRWSGHVWDVTDLGCFEGHDDRVGFRRDALQAAAEDAEAVPTE